MTLEHANRRLVALAHPAVIGVAIMLSVGCAPNAESKDARSSHRISGNPTAEVLSANGSTVSPNDSIEAAATTSIERGVLTVAVALRNRSHRTVHLEWGACSMSRLYRTASLTGRPVFDWQRRPNPDPEIGRWFCPTYLVTRDLAANDSASPRAFIERVEVRRLAGDSLPAGRYYVAAEISLAVNNSARAEERIVVPAGLVQVRR